MYLYLKFYVSKWVKCLVSVFDGIVISSLYSRHIYDNILEHRQWNQLTYASVVVWTHDNHLLNQIDSVHCGNVYGAKIVSSGKSTAMHSLDEDENILQLYPFDALWKQLSDTVVSHEKYLTVSDC